MLMSTIVRHAVGENNVNISFSCMTCPKPNLGDVFRTVPIESMNLRVERFVFPITK